MVRERESKDREQTRLGTFVCDHFGKNTIRSQQRTLCFNRCQVIALTSTLLLKHAFTASKKTAAFGKTTPDLQKLIPCGS